MQVFQRLGARIVYPLTYMLRVSEVLFTVTGLSPAVRLLTAALVHLSGAKRSHHEPLEHPGVGVAIAEGQASGIISHFQSAMASRVVHIEEVTLADAMRPMQQVARVTHNVSRDRLLEVVREHDYSRFPLTGPDGNVVGILDAFDVFESEPDTQPRQLASDALTLPVAMNVTDALYQMQRAGQHMAVVRNGAGRHVGIVTIKDLVEEIVGELKAW